jgi:predicted GTPase
MEKTDELLPETCRTYKRAVDAQNSLAAEARADGHVPADSRVGVVTPLVIALLGDVNVGKSLLGNTLVGQLVFPTGRT